VQQEFSPRPGVAGMAVYQDSIHVEDYRLQHWQRPCAEERPNPGQFSCASW
jgi:hypothetical protein